MEEERCKNMEGPGIPMRVPTRTVLVGKNQEKGERHADTKRTL